MLVRKPKTRADSQFDFQPPFVDGFDDCAVIVVAKRLTDFVALLGSGLLLFEQEVGGVADQVRMHPATFRRLEVVLGCLDDGAALEGGELRFDDWRLRLELDDEMDEGEAHLASGLPAEH